MELINPEGLPEPETYSHVAIASGTKLVFVAGQEPEDAAGNLVGAGDLEAQSRQAFANLGRALAAAGARPDQVTKITIYLVGYRREHQAAVEVGRYSLFGEHKPTDVLVGIQSLAHPEQLIEVDAIAVI
ncbi:RidA family protein [Kribbella sp. NPDC049227]|uniref:RidA family protein n=1 Tax=Kribbella sp. NPDC049227 TaxID=3364113 RepID=UPI0037234AEE